MGERSLSRVRLLTMFVNRCLLSPPSPTVTSYATGTPTGDLAGWPPAQHCAGGHPGTGQRPAAWAAVVPPTTGRTILLLFRATVMFAAVVSAWLEYCG